jgi:hypothetical protein
LPQGLKLVSSAANTVVQPLRAPPMRPPQLSGAMPAIPGSRACRTDLWNKVPPNPPNGSEMSMLPHRSHNAPSIASTAVRTASTASASRPDRPAATRWRLRNVITASKAIVDIADIYGRRGYHTVNLRLRPYSGRRIALKEALVRDTFPQASSATFAAMCGFASRTTGSKSE